MNRRIGRTITLQIFAACCLKAKKHDLQGVFPNRLYLLVRKIQANWLTDSQILTLASDLVSKSILSSPHVTAPRRLVELARQLPLRLVNNS